MYCIFVYIYICICSCVDSRCFLATVYVDIYTMQCVVGMAAGAPRMPKRSHTQPLQMKDDMRFERW